MLSAELEARRNETTGAFRRPGLEHRQRRALLRISGLVQRVELDNPVHSREECNCYGVQQRLEAK